MLGVCAVLTSYLSGVAVTEAFCLPLFASEKPGYLFICLLAAQSSTQWTPGVVTTRQPGMCGNPSSLLGRGTRGVSGRKLLQDYLTECSPVSVSPWLRGQRGLCTRFEVLLCSGEVSTRHDPPRTPAACVHPHLPPPRL